MMAKDKKKNKKDSRVTAGDLLGKLGHGKKASEQDEFADEEFLEDELYNPEEDLDSIDVSSGANAEKSDSDLDINELLRKYMPEYEDEGAGDEQPVSGGILSKLKKTAAAEETAEPDDDAMLLSALDSAFNMTAPAEETPGQEKKSRRYRVVKQEPAVQELPEDSFADEAMPEEMLPEDDLSDGQDALYEEDLPQDEDPAFDESFFEEEKPAKKPGLFAGLFSKSRRKADEDTEIFAQQDELQQDELPEEETDFVDLSDEEAVSEGNPDEDSDSKLLAAAAAVLAKPQEQTELTENDLSEENGLHIADAEQEEDADFSEADELPDEEDPTDINLMVAFGLDGGEDKKSDLAKELGDRLEAKQVAKGKRFKLDRPEYVDKTQTPQIRKEFHDREIKLWVKLVICAVFTGILLVFENISVLTGLFTGSAKQFAGVLDPAVYPGVYIMISLQIMLLACLCAYEEIVSGLKNIFRGTPNPESMTALLMIAGIIYSAVLAHIIEVPNEPVMFNFVAALSALLTIVYAIYNNKREKMNFRIIANKKPKHIVRRLLDEESECEAKAFADADDVCDVMKIEKADFIDGFFGRLRAPEAGTGIFMTFIMGVSVAIAVLFGLFINVRGGDGSMVARVIYAAMLMLTPLSVYMTFSYPFYRANAAAKEYDSAIIGEAALEEYSNASIISFDDKNVFPSYSVKVQNIRIYNNARIDRVLYYAASAFAYAGGPLQDVFEVATKDMGTSSNVQIFDTESGFLATQVDGVNIIFGSCAALRSRGLDISDDAAQDDVDFSDELEIMYMFRENKLVAKMYIQYVMDSDIDLILKQFSGSGLYVCVRTYDPNIDERMIARKLNMKRMPLKIVRYASADEVGICSEKVDSGLVTCGTPKSLLQVISYCGKVLHTKKTNIALSVLSVMIGVAILILLLLADSLATLSSLFIAVYQLIWLIPMMISSKMFIR
ncbi:MAG: hypothetical protein IJC71_05235 [Clostridia bacterium]|nr:hypothetical protein [Clostridia bacterium]